MDPRKVATTKASKGLLDIITNVEFKREKYKVFSVNDLTPQYALSQKVVADLRESKDLLDLEVLDAEEYVHCKCAFLDSTVVVTTVQSERPSTQPATPVPENNTPASLEADAAYSSSDDEDVPSLVDDDSESESVSNGEDSDSADGKTKTL
ncbi:hypothetical protein CYMTET_2827 [Cymbomonas tetramitiformis]|uniref:Uncharacterized protein n=1 Tax=Cymbomonas tetramitiformis TaxID=36881 RepID=A0AAE0LLZ9_9CHLO|nr:hypothetical protein CYMTET_2827 [Cymbomonas tetramitiformis]